MHINLNNILEGYVNCFDCDLKYKKGFDFYCPHSGGKPLSLKGGCILGLKKAKIRPSNVSISTEEETRRFYEKVY